MKLTDQELQEIAEEVAHKIYPDAFAWDDGERGGGQNYVPYYAVDSILPALKQVRDAQEEKIRIAREALENTKLLLNQFKFDDAYSKISDALERMGDV